MKTALTLHATILFTQLLAPMAMLHAAELTVGPGGFQTIGEGVAVLKAGDVLTIMPGEYREQVSATLVGTAEAPVTIRAWRAGSVVMRGDVDFNQLPVPCPLSRCRGCTLSVAFCRGPLSSPLSLRR
jgi:hypothetical protein